MQFLHPAFLLGVGAVAVPILIHLVFKMRARVVLFPSIRFLRQVDRQVARRQKLRDLLLLALRCLALLLLALALAGPVYKPSGGAAGSAGAAVVVVLDDSYSLRLLDAEGPLFTRARSLARAILQSLRPGDAACVLTSRREPRMSRDPGALAAALDGLEPSMGDGTLRPLVDAGLRLLRKTDAAQRELYIVSDFQRRAADLERVDWDVPDFTAVLVPVASPRRDNLTVEALEQISPFATPGAPFRVRVAVANRGPEASGKSMKIRVDDRTAAEPMVFVPAGSTATVAADLLLDRAGWRSVSAELDDDALNADNRRWLAVDVRPSLRVLLVRPEASGALSRGFYVERALNPGGAADTGVQVVSADPSQASDFDLSGFAAAFFADAVPSNGSAVRRVRAYVAEGGSAVFVAGPAMDPAEFDGLAAADGAGEGPLLPVRFAGPVGDERDPQTYQSIRDVDVHHPVFARLQRGATPIDWGAAAFYRIMNLELQDAENARAIARFSSGSPAIVEHRYGNGRVVLIASSLHTDTTTLPVKVGFVPLLHSLVAYLTMPERPEGLRVGEPLRLMLPARAAPETARLHRTPMAAKDVHAAISGGVAIYDFGTASVPGVVTFEWLVPERIASRMAAVNVNPEEGALDYADPAQVVPGARRIRTADELAALLPTIRHGRNWGAVLLVLVLITALAEALLANRFAFGSLRTRSEAPQGWRVARRSV